MNRRARRTFALMLALLPLALSACSVIEGLPEGMIPELEDGNQGDREEMLRPNLSAAAETLGVDEEDLRLALGDPEEGPPDLAAAATELGVTEEALRDALGVPEDGEGAPHEGEKPPSEASGVSSTGGD